MFFEMIGCPSIGPLAFVPKTPKSHPKEMQNQNPPRLRQLVSIWAPWLGSARSWFASPGPRAVQRRLHREPPQLWLQWPPRSLGPGRPDKRARRRGEAVRCERWRRTSGEERDPSYVTRMARNGTHFDPSDVGVWGKYTGSTKNLHL